jgi:hypothetical protein
MRLLMPENNQPRISRMDTDAGLIQSVFIREIRGQPGLMPFPASET